MSKSRTNVGDGDKAEPGPGPGDRGGFLGGLGQRIGRLSELAEKGKKLQELEEFGGEQSRVQVDGVARENAGAAIDGTVEVRRAQSQPARRVVLAPTAITPAERDLKDIGGLLDGLPIVAGDRVRATLFGNRPADFMVNSTNPPGPVVINPTTELEIGKSSGKAAAEKRGSGPRPLSYEEIGGLKRELHRIREIIELPLRYPEVFERLGINPPKEIQGLCTPAARAAFREALESADGDPDALPAIRITPEHLDAALEAVRVLPHRPA